MTKDKLASSISKKEKPDYKQMLLDLIKEKSGIHTAIIMEEALKQQSSQIKEAMGEGGMTAEQIGQSRDVDMGELGGGEPEQPKQPQQSGFEQRKPTSPFAFGGVGVENNNVIYKQPGAIGEFIGGTDNTTALLKQAELLQRLLGGGSQTDPSLIAQREATTAMLNMQLEDREKKRGIDKVYRDPITGAEVDPEQAQKDMEEGLGIYQVNQRLATRAGVMEKPLNKVPDLTQEEKKYVNDARRIGKSLVNLETGFDKLYDKFGKANWQSFQMEKVPYILAQDQDVQSLKSELNYLKADIPFLRGGKQLTPTEAKRVDTMLNPFGKNKETFKKDIARFEEEFLTGGEIVKYGINAGLMKRLIKTDKNKQQKEKQENDTDILNRLNLDPNKYELVR
jgi:hypothetical protein